MKKSHLIILVVVLCVVVAAVLWFSQKEPASPPPPAEVAEEAEPEPEPEPEALPGSREAVVKMLDESPPEEFTPEQREQLLAMYEPSPQLTMDDPVIAERMTKLSELARVSPTYVENYFPKARGVVVESFDSLGVELDEEARETLTRVFVQEAIDQAMRFAPIWERGLENEGTAREIIRQQVILDWESAMFWNTISLHPVAQDLLGDEVMHPAMLKMQARSEGLIEAMDRIDELRKQVDAELME